MAKVYKESPIFFMLGEAIKMGQIREWSGRKRGYINRDTLTAGEARIILAKAKDHGLNGKSKVNRSLTKQQAWDILSAGISKFADDVAIPSLIAKNIQREFGK